MAVPENTAPTARTLEGLPQEIKDNPIPLEEEDIAQIKDALDGETDENTPDDMAQIFQLRLDHVLQTEAGQRLDDEQKAALISFYEQQYQNLMKNIEQRDQRQAFREHNAAQVGSTLTDREAFYGDFSKGNFSHKPLEDFQNSLDVTQIALKQGEIGISASADGKELTAKIQSKNPELLLDHHKDAVRALVAKGGNKFDLTKAGVKTADDLKEVVKEIYRTCDNAKEVGIDDIPQKFKSSPEMKASMEKDLKELYNKRNEFRSDYCKQRGMSPKFNGQKFREDREEYNDNRQEFTANGKTRRELTEPTAGTAAQGRSGNTAQSTRPAPALESTQTPAATVTQTPALRAGGPR